MKAFKKVIIAVAILVLGIVIGFALMLSAFALPTKGMRSHLNESREALVQVNGTSEVIFGYSSTYDGIFTDCLMLQEAIYESGYAIPKAAMGVYRYNYAEDSWLPRDALVMNLDREPGVETDYARYWHGYLVILKPLLMFFNWGELQFFGMAVQLILVCLVFYKLFRRGLSKYAIAFGIALFFLCPIIMPISLSLSICFYLFLIAMLIQLKWHDQMIQKQFYLFFFLIVGMATSYFDFLTYPLVTLGIPLSLYFLLTMKDNYTLKENLLKMIGYPICWSIGYIGMWAAKWGLGSLILGSNVVTDATDTLTQRTGTILYDSRTVSAVHVIIDNLKEYRALPYRLVIVVLIIGVLYSIIRYPGTKTILQKVKMSIPFLFIALFPFMWYFVALNHSGEHFMFTFRALSVSAFSGSCLLMSLFEWGVKRSKT